MKLSDIQKESQYLADNYDFKYMTLDTRDVIKLEIMPDPLEDRHLLRLMYKVRK